MRFRCPLGAKSVSLVVLCMIIIQIAHSVPVFGRKQGQAHVITDFSKQQELKCFIQMQKKQKKIKKLRQKLQFTQITFENQPIITAFEVKTSNIHNCTLYNLQLDSEISLLQTKIY